MVCSATAVGESSRRDEKKCAISFFFIRERRKITSRSARESHEGRERESLKLRDRCLSLCMRWVWGSRRRCWTGEKASSLAPRRHIGVPLISASCQSIKQQQQQQKSLSRKERERKTSISGGEASRWRRRSPWGQPQRGKGPLFLYLKTLEIIIHLIRRRNADGVKDTTCEEEAIVLLLFFISSSMMMMMMTWRPSIHREERALSLAD